jgi:hypothetical protein
MFTLVTPDATDMGGSGAIATGLVMDDEDPPPPHPHPHIVITLTVNMTLVGMLVFPATSVVVTENVFDHCGSGVVGVKA